MMKLSWLALIVVVAIASLRAVEVGDTYQKVMEEKGAPTSKMEAGDSAILRYVDVTITLKDGRVVSIKKTAPGKGSPGNKSPQKPAQRNP